jgi:hypothetical protein
MQPINVTITIQPRHIPKLICSDYSNNRSDDSYNVAIAQAVAEALGVQEFLFHPERIHELQRRLWERGHAMPIPVALGTGD